MGFLFLLSAGSFFDSNLLAKQVNSILPISQKDLASSRGLLTRVTKGTPKHLRSAVVGLPKIYQFKRKKYFGKSEETEPDGFDCSSASCKIIMSNGGEGDAFFTGDKLNLLATSKHNLAKSGPVLRQVIHLKCGSDSNGLPVFDHSVTVEAVVQGQYNMEGDEELDEEDLVLLKTVDSESVYRNYPHFSFNLIDTPDTFESLTAIIKDGAGVLRSQSFVGPDEITISTGAILSLNPNELTRSECDVVGEEWPHLIHTCLNIPGTSGSAIYLDFGKGDAPPRLAGMDSRGWLVDVASKKHAMYISSISDKNKLNLFIPVSQFQAVIQRDPELWESLTEAHLEYLSERYDARRRKLTEGRTTNQPSDFNRKTEPVQPEQFKF